MSITAERSYVYVANAESREIWVFRLDPSSGELHLVEHVLGGKFTVLANTPDRRFMFASLRDEPSGVASFAIDQQHGTLQLLGETRFPGPLAFMTVDGTGRWLLSASYHENFVAVSAIDAEGLVSEPQQVVSSLSKAHSVIASPSNRFVVAAALGADSVFVWPFDANAGRIDEQAVQEVKVAAGAGPRHVRFHPRGDRLYLVNELDASVQSFDFDPTNGRLTPRANASAVPKGFRGKRWAAELQVTPNGKFLYASERTSNTIAAFDLQPSGQLNSLGNVPTERQPRGMAIDPSGRFLFAVGQKSNRLSAYSINEDSGTLTKLKEYAVGGDPCWITTLQL